MRDVDRKAVQYVVEGRVQVKVATFDEATGELVRASGVVKSDRGHYQIRIAGPMVRCDCAWGEAHGETMQSHSHDQALRLQAQREYEGEEA